MCVGDVDAICDAGDVRLPVSSAGQKRRSFDSDPIDHFFFLFGIC